MLWKPSKFWYFAFFSFDPQTPSGSIIVLPFQVIILVVIGYKLLTGTSLISLSLIIIPFGIALFGIPIFVASQTIKKTLYNISDKLIISEYKRTGANGFPKKISYTIKFDLITDAYITQNIMDKLVNHKRIIIKIKNDLPIHICGMTDPEDFLRDLFAQMKRQTRKIQTKNS